MKVLSLCWKPIAIWYKWRVFFLWKRDALECVSTQTLTMVSEWRSISLALLSVMDGISGWLQADWALLSDSFSCFTCETAITPLPLSNSAWLEYLPWCARIEAYRAVTSTSASSRVRKCMCGPAACPVACVRVLCLLCLIHPHSFQLEKKKLS